MKGKFYGVGIGPGDPELITLKAQRILDSAKVIAVPKSAREAGSKALLIAKNIISKDKEILELVFPMSRDEKVLSEGWKEAVREIREKLDGGRDVAFITLGDPTVYSTSMYVHRLIGAMGYDTELVPGITSFCASAAKAGISLAENRETLAVIPSYYDSHSLDSFENFDNIVLMKAAGKFEEIREWLKARGLSENAVVVGDLGFKEERVVFGVDGVEPDELSYFTTIIIKRNGVS